MSNREPNPAWGEVGAYETDGGRGKNNWDTNPAWHKVCNHEAEGCSGKNNRNTSPAWHKVGSQEAEECSSKSNRKPNPAWGEFGTHETDGGGGKSNGDTSPAWHKVGSHEAEGCSGKNSWKPNPVWGEVGAHETESGSGRSNRHASPVWHKVGSHENERAWDENASIAGKNQPPFQLQCHPQVWEWQECRKDERHLPALQGTQLQGQDARVVLHQWKGWSSTPPSPFRVTPVTVVWYQCRLQALSQVYPHLQFVLPDDKHRLPGEQLSWVDADVQATGRSLPSNWLPIPTCQWRFKVSPNLFPQQSTSSLLLLHNIRQPQAWNCAGSVGLSPWQESPR